MARDPEQLARRDHQQWIGYVQPVGLVVSVPALLAAQAHVNRNIAAEHQQFLGCLRRGNRGELIPEIRDFPSFTQKVFGWEPADLVDLSGDTEAAKALEVALPEYSETLRPTWAVKEFEPSDRQKPWMMLIQAYPIATDLDKNHARGDRHWQASPQARIERLLRETEVPAGLLFNGTHLRLVYAPRGETSGYATFPVAQMAEVAGRPMFAALHMLLEAPRLFSLPARQRLPAVLAESRKYQNVVSTQLAEQVLAALYELVRGFQAADDYRKGRLLADVLRENPNHVYAGLLTVLMRLVFVLYAEDRGLLSSDPVYANFYSVTGLFDRLRADAGRYPDTMDQRYGAWAQLLTLFRMIHEGGRHGGLRIPARRGYLFDPDRYNFLEGRPSSEVSCPSSVVSCNGPRTTDHGQLTTYHGPRTTDKGPTPEQILDLKICDPAMGSGAFLVETCRQLGDELVKAWHVHKQAPKLPPDEDEVLHARRLIAQRCLYGVDKNPMAVDLAKLSLWLATLAKEHPFTFLDHSLRAGDSLVGLSARQIAAFHWKDVSGPSSVVRGPSSVVSRPSSVVRGPSSVVRGQSSVVRGPWSVVRGQSSVVRRH